MLAEINSYLTASYRFALESKSYKQKQLVISATPPGDLSGVNAVVRGVYPGATAPAMTVDEFELEVDPGIAVATRESA